MMIIRISQTLFQLSKKVISPMMFQLNEKVIMKLTIGKQFPMRPQKRESNNEIDEKIYIEPKLETGVEIEKQAIIDEEKFIKTELEANKIDLETSKEAEINKIEDIFDEVKEEDPLKDIESFFIDDNDIFDHDEISESDRQLTMDLIGRTNFIADIKKFIEYTGTAKMEIVDPTIKQKMEKKEQISITDDEKQYQAVHEHNLMKKFKRKNEFLNEEEKTTKRSKKCYRKQVKERMGEYYSQVSNRRPPPSAN